jgi:hypothetical protein
MDVNNQKEISVKAIISMPCDMRKQTPVFTKLHTVLTHMIFEVYMMVKMWVITFWVVRPYSLLGGRLQGVRDFKYFIVVNM